MPTATKQPEKIVEKGKAAVDAAEAAPDLAVALEASKGAESPGDAIAAGTRWASREGKAIHRGAEVRFDGGEDGKYAGLVITGTAANRWTRNVDGEGRQVGSRGSGISCVDMVNVVPNEKVKVGGKAVKQIGLPASLMTITKEAPAGARSGGLKITVEK